jgi:acetate kinase
MNPILVLNAGSTSLRFALFGPVRQGTRLLEGSFSGIGRPLGRLDVRRGPGDAFRQETLALPDQESCLTHLLRVLKSHPEGGSPSAIGHRVVHGGSRLSLPTPVDPSVLEELRRNIPMAPGHLPGSVALLEWCGSLFPGVPQVACFDTCFHRSLPDVATRMAIPRRHFDRGIRKYGFHGLSYSGAMEQLRDLGEPAATRGALVLAHLGGGSSLAAVRDGVCIDTTMGLTPSAGLPMGTRAGDLDPGLPGYLARTEGMSPLEFEHMVHHESGLLGISGISPDMVELLGREESEVGAAEAIACYCREAKKRIGAYAAVLGGLDALGFTGGIGGNCPTIRTRICEGLGFLGVDLDPAANAANAPRISSNRSRVTVRIHVADEERQILLGVESALALPAGAPANAG